MLMKSAFWELKNGCILKHSLLRHLSWDQDSSCDLPCGLGSSCDLSCDHTSHSGECWRSHDMTGEVRSIVAWKRNVSFATGWLSGHKQRPIRTERKEKYENYFCYKVIFLLCFSEEPAIHMKNRKQQLRIYNTLRNYTWKAETKREIYINLKVETMGFLFWLHQMNIIK